MHALAGRNTMTFESLDVGSSFLLVWYISRGYQIIYSHWVRVKVTGATMEPNPYSCYVKLQSVIIAVL